MKLCAAGLVFVWYFFLLPFLCGCNHVPEERVFIVPNQEYYYAATSPNIPPGARSYPKSQVVAQGYTPFPANSHHSTGANGGLSSTAKDTAAPDATLDTLTGLKADDTILIRFTILEPTQANLYFPMDGTGPPEFTTFLSVQAVYESQEAHGDAPPLLDMFLGEIKLGAGFSAMDAAREIRVPAAIIAKRLEACRMAYGPPANLRLKLQLMEDDYFLDDEISTCFYPLMHDQRKTLEFSERYVSFNLYVLSEGVIDVEHGGAAQGPAGGTPVITTNFERPTEEPDVPEILTPKGLAAVLRQAFVWFLEVLATLLIILPWRGKISSDFWINLFQVGAVALLLTAVHTGLGVFNQTILGGGMFIGAFAPFHFLMLMWILYYFYELNLIEFVLVVALNIFIQICVFGIFATLRTLGS